ncbi:hypothetical protein [Nonomuraea cavernae]|uniref:hypothetical protein n=1 Tax=Nonomuraea cavernae TaxID=2045107 RepID=UPI00166AFE23|nr:hypothetical protein [Nonomuraea cavernae]MCA2186721.1 hypothetical protein [Nonomuraea cavernae]
MRWSDASTITLLTGQPDLPDAWWRSLPLPLVLAAIAPESLAELLTEITLEHWPAASVGDVLPALHVLDPDEADEPQVAIALDRAGSWAGLLALTGRELVDQPFIQARPVLTTLFSSVLVRLAPARPTAVSTPAEAPGAEIVVLEPATDDSQPVLDADAEPLTEDASEPQLAVDADVPSADSSGPLRPRVLDGPPRDPSPGGASPADGLADVFRPRFRAVDPHGQPAEDAAGPADSPGLSLAEPPASTTADSPSDPSDSPSDQAVSPSGTDSADAQPDQRVADEAAQAHGRFDDSVEAANSASAARRQADSADEAVEAHRAGRGESQSREPEPADGHDGSEAYAADAEHAEVADANPADSDRANAAGPQADADADAGDADRADAADSPAKAAIAEANADDPSAEAGLAEGGPDHRPAEVDIAEAHRDAGDPQGRGVGADGSAVLGRDEDVDGAGSGRDGEDGPSGDGGDLAELIETAFAGLDDKSWAVAQNRVFTDEPSAVDQLAKLFAVPPAEIAATETRLRAQLDQWLASDEAAPYRAHLDELRRSIGPAAPKERLIGAAPWHAKEIRALEVPAWQFVLATLPARTHPDDEPGARPEKPGALSEAAGMRPEVPSAFARPAPANGAPSPAPLFQAFAPATPAEAHPVEAHVEAHPVEANGGSGEQPAKPYQPLKDVSQTRRCFRQPDGRWWLRIDVTAEQLAGGECALPTGFAAYLGLSPGETRSVRSAAGALTMTWHGRPVLESIERLLVDVGAKEGGHLFLTLSDEGVLRARHLPVAAQSAEKITRALRLVGYTAPGGTKDQAARVIATRIGMTGPVALPDLFTRLRERGDRDLLVLLD